MSSSTTRLGRAIGMAKMADNKYYAEDLNTPEKFNKAMLDKDGTIMIGYDKPKSGGGLSEQLKGKSDSEILSDLKSRTEKLKPQLDQHVEDIKNARNVTRKVEEAVNRNMANEGRLLRNLGIGAGAVAVPGLAYLAYRATRKNKGK